MSGEAIYFEEVNLMSLTNLLAEKIQNAGGEIFYGCEVEKVRKKENSFEIELSS